MAIYNQGKLAGIVGYKQLYPNGAMYTLNELLTGLPRIWAIRLVSNMQNKLVGKPFYNPDFKDEETTQMDVPRFFFGPENLDQLLDVIHKYKDYLVLEAERQQQPMEYAAGSETPLLLLKYIMAMPASNVTANIAQLERNLYTAFLIANEITFNRSQGKPPYKQEDDSELYLASLLMSRYAYNDFTNQESDLNELVRNQNRTSFVCLPSKKNWMYIYADKNTSGKDRELKITLTAGDIFHDISVKQLANIK